MRESGGRSLRVGKTRIAFPGFPFRHPQFENRLQIQPKLRARTEEVSKSKSCIAGNGASTLLDLGDAISRHLQLTRQLGRSHPKGREFFSQMFTRMYCGYRHKRFS
jgi:hypothetical protein